MIKVGKKTLPLSAIAILALSYHKSGSYNGLSHTNSMIKAGKKTLLPACGPLWVIDCNNSENRNEVLWFFLSRKNRKNLTKPQKHDIISPNRLKQ